jgi:hypothetical protein
VEQRAVLLKDRLTLAKQLCINKDADVQYGKLSTIVSAIPTEVQPINLEGNDAQIESSFSIRTPQDLSTFIQLMQSSTNPFEGVLMKSIIFSEETGYTITFQYQ